MNRTIIGMLLAVSCLIPGTVLGQGVQEHPQPSTTTTTAGAKALTGTAATVTAPSSSEPEQSVTRKGRARMQNLLNKRKGLPQSAHKIRGTWSFTGDLLQTTCPEDAEQTTVTHDFTVEQNEDVLYVTSGAGIEFLGDLGADGEFALSSSTSDSLVSPSCTQEAILLISGNVQHRRASFSIVTDFVGDCPATNNCESVYEGPFTQVRAKE